MSGIHEAEDHIPDEDEAGEQALGKTGPQTRPPESHWIKSFVRDTLSVIGDITERLVTLGRDCAERMSRLPGPESRVSPVLYFLAFLAPTIIFLAVLAAVLSVIVILVRYVAGI